MVIGVCPGTCTGAGTWTVCRLNRLLVSFAWEGG